MATVMTPSAAAALSGVPVDKSGVGSAVLNTSRQVGGSMGIAVMGAIMAHAIGDRRTPQAFAAGFMDGFSTALVVAGLIACGGVIVAATLVRAHVRRDEAAAPIEVAA
jgi:branched-subunit amino acid permease